MSARYAGYHFRLGSTSYVHAAGLVENAWRLAGLVDDVELVLFELEDGRGNLPSEAEVEELGEIAGQRGLTFTVHLPLDLRGDLPRDSRLWRLTERVVRAAAPLKPWAWVFHMDGGGVGSEAWRRQAMAALDRLCSLVDDPTTLALENLESYAPDHLEWLFERAPISRTLDVGHLWKAGLEPQGYLEKWLPHCRVVHLHGCHMQDRGRVDHLALGVLEPVTLRGVLRPLRSWSGVLTLEVFETDFFSSLSTLDHILRPQPKHIGPTHD